MLISCAPVIIFAFNRPEHLRRVIESLLKNSLSSETDIYIYSDGARAGDYVNQDKIIKLRDFAKSISGFRTINIVARESNFGLCDNIIEGVSSVIEEHGRAIILEDDIVVHENFLKYMNDALVYYKDNLEVFSVTSHLYPGLSSNETSLLPLTCSWGWATWNSRWKLFEREPAQLMNEIKGLKRIKFNFWGAFDDLFSQVKQNYDGSLKTWAVFWYATAFKHGAMTVYPPQPMSINIGFDGSGENCPNKSIYEFKLDSKVDSFTYATKASSMKFIKLWGHLFVQQSIIRIKRIILKYVDFRNKEQD